jgi:hypothetical protein
MLPPALPTNDVALPCRLYSKGSAGRDELPAAPQQRAGMVSATIHPGGASHTHGAAQRRAQVGGAFQRACCDQLWLKMCGSECATAASVPPPGRQLML